MKPPYPLSAGRVVTVPSAFGPLRGLIVSGPYSAGAPGESWLVSPLLERASAETDELPVEELPGTVASAWAAQSVPTRLIVPTELDLPKYADSVLDLVIAVQDGTIESPMGDRSREATLRQWYAAVTSTLPAPTLNDEITTFLARQMALFISSECAAMHLSEADLEQLARYVEIGPHSVAISAPHSPAPERGWTNSYPVPQQHLSFKACAGPLARAS